MSRTPLKFNPFSSAALAAQSLPPKRVVRMVSLGICAAVGISLIFAVLVSMDIVVTAQGRVSASGKSKVIQPLDAGVVKAIAVRDGQARRRSGATLPDRPSSAHHG
jgi:hemolysin D